MQSLDLYNLREFCTARRIMLCFNGPMSRSLIEEIGNALRNHLKADQVQPGAAMDVFAAYIEMTQNIRHYAQRMGYADAAATATVVVAQDDAGRYVVSAGNLIENEHADALVARVRDLAPLDKAELKARYKEQLRAPRNGGAATGAGLGLLDIARRASAPIECSLTSHDDGKAFFSLVAHI